jgi:hypothetical protein
MSETGSQVRLRQLELKQITDRRLAIAALVVSIIVGLLTYWNVRTQNAALQRAQARQGWSEQLLRADDEQLWRAKKNLRAFVEQVKRLPDALRERGGMDPFITRTSQKCLALYGYLTTVPVAGSSDDCPPKSMKPEDKERYYSDLDMSRRLVKDLHEKLMLLDKQGLIDDAVLQRFLSESTVDFLTNVWLPIEKGLNHVVEKDADSKDRTAQAVRDWYAERLTLMREQNEKNKGRQPEPAPETSYY